MDLLFVDFCNIKRKLGVSIAFPYEMESFDEVRTIIKSNGGKFSKKIKKWIIFGEFAFYCVDLLHGIRNIKVLYSDYFKYFMKEELKFIDERYNLSKVVTSDTYIPVPQGLEYLPYQKAVVDFFEDRNRKMLLADEAGTGKSISTIAIVNSAEYEKVLIICPDSIKYNWERELNKWLVTKRRIYVQNAGKDYDSVADIVVINYDILENFLDKILDHNFDFIVIDEGHLIKTTTAKRSIAIRKILHDVKDKIVLTGTPMPNRPIELFNIIDLFGGLSFGDLYSYSYRYCDGELKTIIKNEKEISFLSNIGSSNEVELNYKLRASLMMRRMKKDVINQLPKAKRHIVKFDIGKNNTIDDFRKNLSSFTNNMKMIKKTKGTYNKYDDFVKAIDDVKKLYFDQVSNIRYQIGMKKIDYVVEFVNKLLETNKKIVLFAHHRGVIDAIHERFKKNSIILVGGTTSKNKMKIVDKFNNDENVNLFIGSIGASNVGFTLVSSSTIVMAEFDWTPGVMDQCESRCLRLGQKNDVDIYYMVAGDSSDYNMLKKLRNKGNIIDVVTM